MTAAIARTSVALLSLAALGCALRGAGDAEPAAPADAPATAAPQPFAASIPGSTLSLDMVPVPGGTVRVSDPGAPGGAREVELAPLWLSATEIPWEVYDAFVFGAVEAEAAAAGADAIARPSKPYILVDRGFGRGRNPAISMSLAGAEAFCAWLSARTGRTWRLPSEAEWEHACLAGGEAPPDEVHLERHAWHRENSGGSTHPVGSKAPNAWGLHDMLGNAAEWCRALDGAGGVVCGGSYLDPAAAVSCASRKAPDPSWNASDPQVPKSRWWLADAGFVGFRVVCEEPPETAAERP